MTIYEKVIDLCTLHQIDKTSLESACGFSQNSINKWKTSSPSIDKLIKVADYFEVTLDELVGRKTVLTWKQFIHKCSERKISIEELQNELTIKHPNGSIECLLTDAIIFEWENGQLPNKETLWAINNYFAHHSPIIELSQPQLDILEVFAKLTPYQQGQLVGELRTKNITEVLKRLNAESTESVATVARKKP